MRCQIDIGKDGGTNHRLLKYLATPSRQFARIEHFAPFIAQLFEDSNGVPVMRARSVVGVMITFAIIAKSGEVDVNSIAPGIASALLATTVGLLVAICIIPLFFMIAFEGRTRPPRPAHVKLHHLAFQYAMWPGMMIITFFWASLPALHAQWRLATGQGLVYLVAEKNRRSAPTALVLQSADVSAPAQENA